MRFQLKKVKKKRPEGNLTEVLVPSEIEKAVPPCPHFSECGGCAYQTLPYQEQMCIRDSGRAVSTVSWENEFGKLFLSAAKSDVFVIRRNSAKRMG